MTTANNNKVKSLIKIVLASVCILAFISPINAQTDNYKRLE